jgi:predicted hydrocarbon binding protein/predicted amino acid-binding ACT domain protein
LENVRPLDLSRVIRDFNETILFASLELKNRPGALLSVLMPLAKLGVNIIGIHSEAVTLEDYIEVSLFLDVKTSKIKAKDLEQILNEQIRLLDVVKEVKVFDHLPHKLDADLYHFPLEVHGRRAVVFTRLVLEDLIVGLRKVLQESAAKEILWLQGKEAGENLSGYYEKHYNAKDIKEKLELFRIYSFSLGWGIVSFESVDKERKEATVEIFNSFECSLFNESKQPESQLIRGMLAGFFSSLFSTEANAIEEKCIAKGDPYCSFIIKKGE